ncbi:MAG: hypothetical protein AB4290_21050, partial [Spirulina sp.]
MPANSSSIDKELNIDPQLSFIPDAGLLDPLTPSNSPQNNSSSSSDPLPPPPPNTRPQLQFVNFEKTEYRHNETLRVTSGKAADPDGFSDLAGIDFRIRLGDGSYLDITDATTFQEVNNTTGSFTYDFDLGNLNLTPGTHQLGLFAIAYDQSGLRSNSYAELDFRIINTAPENLHLSILPRQGDYFPGNNGISFLNSDTLLIEGFLEEYDGLADLEKIDLSLYNPLDGSIIDIADVTNFEVDPLSSPEGFSFQTSLVLSSLGLSPQPSYQWE